MKTTLFAVLTGMLALVGVTHAEEAKKKEKKPLDPAILEKYDKDKDGKLSKEEKAEMKKDKQTQPKKEKVKKTKKPKEGDTEAPPQP